MGDLLDTILDFVSDVLDETSKKIEEQEQGHEIGSEERNNVDTGDNADEEDYTLTILEEALEEERIALNRKIARERKKWFKPAKWYPEPIIIDADYEDL